MKPNKLNNPWSNYEVREGSDGKPGIYLRDFNVRLATFSDNSFALQTKLAELFDAEIVAPPIDAMKSVKGR